MRTFVAVEIDDKNILDSIRKIQSGLKISANPVSISNIHFTLFFLGEISEIKCQQVQSNLEKIEFEPFEVAITGIGAFPKPRFPRIIWVGTDEEGGKKLIELALKIEKNLSTLGFRSDKPFKPHITIFRVKNKIGNISDELKKFATFSFGNERVTKIKFKQSVLTPNGPIYSDLLVVNAKL